MIRKIKQHSNKKNKRLLSNIFSLFVLKGADYIIPLILLPYLVRVLGIENFGLLAFATSTISFFRTFVAYGFDFSGTQQIASNSDNTFKINEVFSAVIVTKAILASVSFIVLSFILIFINKFNENYMLYIFTFLIVFGDVLFPVWYFQGLEKMKFITYLRLSYKAIFLLSIMIFVKSNDDFILVPLLDALGYIITGLFSLYISHRYYHLQFIFPSLSSITWQLKNGWHIFLSQISVTFYSSINTFLLGLLATNEAVGFYSLAYKLYLALRGLLSPITQSLFPFLTKEYKTNKQTYYKKVRYISIMYSILLVLIALMVYVFSNDIIKLVSGNNIKESTNVLNILLFALPFSIGSFYSSLLVIKSEGKILFKITLTCMVINLCLVFPSIYFYGIYGLAWQFVVVQMIQSVLQVKYNFEIWRDKR